VREATRPDCGLTGRFQLDLAALGKHVTAKLPRYARPLFLRVVKELETTSTNKQQKVKLRTEGIDPDLVKDPM
jgi:hypothetical protein